MKKKLFLLIFLLTACFCGLRARALPQTLYETTESSVITRGLTMDKVTRFTVDGWLTFEVLRVDLKDRYLTLDSIYNQTSITSLSTVGAYAQDAGAVAAVNASYFTMSNGSAIGTMMRNGVIDTADSVTNAEGDVMASMTADRLKKLAFGFVKANITMLGDKGAALWVNSYNKMSDENGFSGIYLFDRKFRKDSIGATQKYPDIVELVVENGVVREIRDAQPPVEIPVNGFVAVTRKRADGSVPFGTGFQVGAPCSFKVELTPPMDDAAFHIEGASMLVRDGKIMSYFSYNPPDIAKRNPRTLLGASANGEQLIAVVVEGRLANSIGLDTVESAELMLSLG
ncbi:MAG: phosphodiester glycosidase family protein, partial [Clostridiales bacterium]|nr:phosphodiester glycosidase family protein [Clostridiales bacterium]